MRVNRYLCDVCGSCVAVCPVDAIVVNETFVDIDNKKCIKCLNCVQVCPIKAIDAEE